MLLSVGLVERDRKLEIPLVENAFVLWQTLSITAYTCSPFDFKTDRAVAHCSTQHPSVPRQRGAHLRSDFYRM